MSLEIGFWVTGSGLDFCRGSIGVIDGFTSRLVGNDTMTMMVFWLCLTVKVMC